MRLSLNRTNLLAVAAAIPIVVPAVYIIWLDWRVSKKTTSASGRWKDYNHPGPAAANSAIKLPQSIPDETTSDGSEWIVTYERVVSHPVPTSSLAYHFDGAYTSAQVQSGIAAVSNLLKAYTRATHVAFSWTPQAFAIRASTKDDRCRKSFDTDQIMGLDFEEGDVVNGVYRVAAHSATTSPASETIELVLEAPPDYQGPIFNGLILTRIEAVGTRGEDKSMEVSNVVFVNETWMWRKPDDKATLLESKVGAWVHKVMAGWLITKGVEAVTTKA